MLLHRLGVVVSCLHPGEDKQPLEHTIKETQRATALHPGAYGADCGISYNHDVPELKRNAVGRRNWRIRNPLGAASITENTAAQATHQRGSYNSRMIQRPASGDRAKRQNVNLRKGWWQCMNEDDDPTGPSREMNRLFLLPSTSTKRPNLGASSSVIDRTRNAGEPGELH